MHLLDFLSDRPAEEVTRLLDEVEDSFSLHTLEKAISRITRREGTGRIEALFWNSADRKRGALTRILAGCCCSEEFYVRCMSKLDDEDLHGILLDPRSPLHLLTPASALTVLRAAWSRVLHRTETRSRSLDLIDGLLARIPLVQDRQKFLADAGTDLLSSEELRGDVAIWLASDARRAITFRDLAKRR
jgi:hypothetical protein